MSPQRQLQSGVKAISKPAYLSTNTEPGCEDRFVKDARLDKEPIKILLDTGSKMSIVKADLVNQTRWNIEDRAPIQCVHGDQLTYPTAVVLLEINGWSKVLKVALVPQMPVDMIVGAGDYCPDGILPTLAHKNDEPGCCLMVTTRSQSKKILTQKGPAAGTSDKSPESKEKGITSKSHIGTDVIIQATAEQLKHWHESLREVRRMATSEEMRVTNYGRATFFYKEGILYRRWVPRKLQNRDLKTCEQLVLPLRCRSVVMQIGHDTPMANRANT